jgi:hypothetical protein
MIAELIAAAGMAVGMPVSCIPAVDGIAAQYSPREFRVEVTAPYCTDVRRGTDMGAWLLGHELGHAWQDAMHLPFDEDQADRLANGWAPALQRALGGRPGSGPQPDDPPVKLGG